MPAPGQEETVRIVALDRDFHVQCYRCEVGPPSLGAVRVDTTQLRPKHNLPTCKIASHSSPAKFRGGFLTKNPFQMCNMRQDWEEDELAKLSDCIYVS